MVLDPIPFVHPLTGVIPSHGTRYPLRGGLRRVHLGRLTLSALKSCRHPNPNLKIVPTLDLFGQVGPRWRQMGCGMRHHLRVIHVWMVWYLIGTLRPSQRYLLGDPILDLEWVLLSMSAEQIVSKWSFSSGWKHPILNPLQPEVLRWYGGPHER